MSDDPVISSPSAVVEEAIGAAVDTIRRYVNSLRLLSSWRERADNASSVSGGERPLTPIIFFVISYGAFATALKFSGISTLENREALQQLRNSFESLSILHIAVAVLPSALLVVALGNLLSLVSPAFEARGVLRDAIVYSVGLILFGLAVSLTVILCLDAIIHLGPTILPDWLERLRYFIWWHYDSVSMVVLFIPLLMAPNHLFRTLWRLTYNVKQMLRRIATVAWRLTLIAAAAFAAVVLFVVILGAEPSATRVLIIRPIRLTSTDLTKPPMAAGMFMIENRSDRVVVFNRTAFLIHFVGDRSERQKPRCFALDFNAACQEYYTPLTIDSWSAGDNPVAVLKPHDTLFVAGTAHVPWKRDSEKPSTGRQRNPFATSETNSSGGFGPGGMA